MKEKILYTNCQYGKCGKELAYPSTIRKYCNNNNKCKNDFHNSVREMKAAFADHVVDLVALAEEYERILDLILQNRYIKIIHIDYLVQMGIDLSADIMNLKYCTEDLSFFQLTFKNYLFYYFVKDKQVSIWRNKRAS
jgi:hypothetical protein